MTELHSQLIKQGATDFAQNDINTPTTNHSRILHTIEQINDFREVGKQRMRQRHSCKVCSIKFRKMVDKSNETSWFCVQCSEEPSDCTCATPSAWPTV